MTHRLRMIITEYGRDEEHAERVLDAFWHTHPEVGAVVSQDTEDGTLSITTSVNAPNALEAWEKGYGIYWEALDASGLPPTDIVELQCFRITEGEVDGVFADELEYLPVA